MYAYLHAHKQNYWITLNQMQPLPYVTLLKAFHSTATHRSRHWTASTKTACTGAVEASL